MRKPSTKLRHAVATAIAVTAFIIAPAATRAATIFYTDASSFSAAEPGLPVESFPGANLSSQPEGLQTSPLSSATNGPIFASGSILPGLTISNLNPALTPGLIVYAGGPGSSSVGDNYFGDPLVLSFGGVSAVGADVFANTSPGLSLAGNFTETVFNGTTQLGMTNFSEAAGAFAFIGVSSTTPITSVQLLYTTDDATTFATDISFGATTGGGTTPTPPPIPTPPPTPVPPTTPPPITTPTTATPEPSSFALLCLGAILAGLGFLARKRSGAVA